MLDGVLCGSCEIDCVLVCDKIIKEGLYGIGYMYYIFTFSSVCICKTISLIMCVSMFVCLLMYDIK